MRIINGIHKGKSIIAPKDLPVRPTTDFAKEGLFNILSNEFDIDNLEVLDLFSGTGNIAFEFASRGAKKVLCIDANYHCVSFIKKTSSTLNFKQLSVFKNDVFKYLKQYTQSFDLIFADPPYDLKEIPVIPQLIFDNKLLNKDGWLIVEHDKRTDLSDHSNFVVQRKYGNVHFSIFQH
ncbi:MAG: 16S rRNA (guanine(966)-N(2))-methyltransferase RsmD [Vicingus serpentipes]|nr:16S rRNA (guanine(966)-N(2))-methyltransferase RsmD [Vicingus serpentipes]